MTPNEVNEACTKFVDYLRANGVSVYAFMMMCDGCSFKGGVSEMIDEMIVRHGADRLGFTLEEKK